MAAGRIIGAGVAGLGLVGGSYLGLAGQDDTVRNDAGEVVEGGEIGAFRIREGDCIGDPANGAEEFEFESVEGIPCDQPHEIEVYHAFNLTGSAYPGESAIQEGADQGCYDAFPAFVGTSYEASEFGFGTVYPSAGSWAELDDREVLCMLQTIDGTQLTGSVRGSGR